jgi:predicted GIY-YIG superfamily endonuclease
MHYVYFLELSNGNIGFSSNLKQRIKAHNDAKVPATAGFLPAGIFKIGFS